MGGKKMKVKKITHGTVIRCPHCRGQLLLVSRRKGKK